MAEETKKDLTNVEDDNGIKTDETSIEDTKKDDAKFTQDDVNKLVGETRKEANIRLWKQWGATTKEEYQEKVKEYNEFKESQKTEEQRQKELKEKYDRELEETKKQTTKLKTENEFLKTGFNAKYKNSAISEAKALMSNDPDLTMTEAFEKVSNLFPEWKTVVNFGDKIKKDDGTTNTKLDEKMRRAILGR